MQDQEPVENAVTVTSNEKEVLDTDNKTEEISSEADHDEVDESDESVEESDPSDKEKEKAKAKKPGGFQKRIKKLTSKLSAKEQEASYWRDIALKNAQKETPQAEVKAVSKNDKPAPDEFESHDEYIDALTDWKVEQKLESFEVKQKQARVQSDVQTRVKTHNERVKSFAESHDDFHEVMEEVDDIVVPLAVQEILVESDHGPQLMYELAKNREELERICKMTPLKAAVAMGAFEEKLNLSQKSKSTNQSKQTKAPPPPTPIRGRSEKAMAKSIYDKNIEDQAEYEALRRKQRSR